MNKFEVKNPTEMDSEELLEYYLLLHTAVKLSPESISTKCYHDDIKSEILKRMGGVSRD